MKVLFVDSVHPSLQQKLESNNFICHQELSLSKSEIEEVIIDYEGLVIRSRFNIDQKFIDKASNLKFIARAGSGLENINVEYAKLKNIRCYNAAEGNRQAVAEHALAMLLSLFNNIIKSDEEVRNGIWRREDNRGIELSGKTLAIIGYGNNGSAFAEILKGFKVKILAYDKYLDNYSYKSSMNNIFNNADIVSLHVPLTKETEHIVNSGFINKFRKNIYVVNTARGKCVNTRDLVNAMKEGKVKGACLDVLEYEKSSFETLSESGGKGEMKFLIESKNTILSPHIAGWSSESNIKISKVLYHKISSDFIF
tara:strand:+ start:9584 stop:10513 length:930 start_codon:yes stop_codon:yes gene_type:complete